MMGECSRSRAGFAGAPMSPAGIRRIPANRIVYRRYHSESAAAATAYTTPAVSRTNGHKLTTTKRFKVKGAQISITWPKKNVRPKDVNAALEEALEQTRATTAEAA